MDTWMILLRLLHVVFGTFWAGTAFFMVLFLEPRLRSLGPPVQGRVMQALMPILTPVFTVSSIIVVVTGVVIALELRDLDTLFVNDWGWAILVGLIATLAAIVVGLGLTTPTGLRMTKLSQSIEGRPPTPEEAQQLQSMSHRVETLSRISAVLLFIAVGTMAAARFLY